MSAVEIKVEYKGQSYSARDCSWLLYAPCGCLAGATIAGGRHGMPLQLDERQAWKEMYDSPEVAERDKADGWRLELEPHSNIPTPWERCTHTPVYGRTPRPQPEGWVWGEPERGRRLHLYREGERWTKLVALCGAESYPDLKHPRDLLECSKCVSRASGVLPAADEGMLV